MKNELISEPLRSSGKYKLTEHGLIPNEWGVHQIQSLIDRGHIVGHMDGNHGALYPRSNEFSVDGVPYIAATDFINGKVDFRTCKHLPIERAVKFQKGFARNGDVLFAHNATVGPVAFLCTSEDFVILSTTATYYRTNNQKLLNKYLFYFLQSDLFKFQYSSIMAQSTRSQVPITTQRKLDVILPPLPEQTAIAEALSDADAMIASLEKLIEKKKKIKQGAMQELLRPKEGWVKKKIRDISVVGRGRVISHKEISAAITGMFPVYSSQTSNNGIMGHIDTFDFDGEYVTWTTDGEKAGTVFYRSGKFNCTNVCGTIKLKTDYARFVSLMLGNEAPKHVSRNLANPKLMNEPMKNIEIDLPPLHMQREIAHVILELESEIEVNNMKLEKLVRIKQGMMQNLLTGKIRLV